MENVIKRANMRGNTENIPRKGRPKSLNFRDEGKNQGNKNYLDFENIESKLEI